MARAARERSEQERETPRPDATGLSLPAHVPGTADFGLQPSQPLERVREFLDIARAAATGTPAAGYSPSSVAVDEAAAGSQLPLFVGARGPRLNRLASERADGAFVAGMPPFRYPTVVGWARSVRPIDIALYPSVAPVTETSSACSSAFRQFWGKSAMTRHR